MDQDTFNELADLALNGSGQIIAPSKVYLIEARLASIARREGFATMADLVGCLKARPNPAFEAEIVAALASHDTRFFRSKDAVEHIVQHLLPGQLTKSETGKLRIWCAGGSAGQEAYSIAILLSEAGPDVFGDTQIDILSTDFCPIMTERARAGTYGHFEIQKGLSVHRMLEHFKRQETGNWQISNELRSQISFRKHNLLEDMTGLGMFDVIFCQNVLSGVNKPLQKDIGERLGAQLAKGGLLMLGQGESLVGITEQLQPNPDVRNGYVSVTKPDRTQAA